MAFPDRELEQRRVEAAASMGLKLDPRSTLDVAAVAFFGTVYAIDLLAVVYLLWNHRYPPLKSKGPILMALLFAGSVLWFVGDIQANGIVPLAGSALARCRVFAFWVQMLLGGCLFSAVLGIRLYMLFHVFRLNMSARGWRFFAPVAAYLACLAAFGVLSVALGPEVTSRYDAALDVCDSNTPLTKAVVAFAWVSIALVVALTWAIRNIKSSFDESREMTFACALMLASLVFSTAVHFARPHYALSRGYRIAATAVNHVTANAVWWALLGRPLLNCALRRDAYLRRWVAQLQQDGLQHQYNLEDQQQQQPQSVLLGQPLKLDNNQYSSNVAYSVSNADVRLWTPRKSGEMREIASAWSDGGLSLQRRFAHAFGTLTLSRRDIPAYSDSFRDRSRTVSWQPSTVLHDDDSFRVTSSHSKHAL
ncbi:hypothetical protein GGI11_002453 [Coemansia sp. RSA 2049]|nr:hypothetical protein H4217_006060 [Coemansia sp. RSA 1939]KAJ2519855.1 hypothetical protein GGI11_002453 [Coemansia sp. RSA 2049]KAJ2606807.1 hypothetical protein EV177_005845 [Coemansia sp. RSA 1804]KAJ2684249.1 hypothetical protein GGH99_004106 [Coemansia sp. RSA 1285]